MNESSSQSKIFIRSTRKRKKILYTKKEEDNIMAENYGVPYSTVVFFYPYKRENTIVLTLQLELVGKACMRGVAGPERDDDVMKYKLSM